MKFARTAQVRPIVAAVCLLTAASIGLGCSSPPPPQHATGLHPSIDVEVYRRAETERAARLAAEVERLRADLVQAEEALVTAESGLRGTHSRANAVSGLAEARIQVERAAASAPWRTAEIAEARAKLDEAAFQVEEGHFGAALFFVYRAERIASQVEDEADQVLASSNARFVQGRRVNLRAGPSTDESVLAVLSSGTPVFPEKNQAPWILVRTPAGAIGWVHDSLLGGAH